MLKSVRYITFLLVVICSVSLTWPTSAQASTNIRVNVCPAINTVRIVPPTNTTYSASVVLNGMTKPGINLKVSNNGQLYPSATVQSLSSFRSTIPLRVGSNIVRITASNICGQSRTTDFAISRLTRGTSWQIWVLYAISLLIILLIMLLILYKRHRQEDARKKAAAAKRRKSKSSKRSKK